MGRIDETVASAEYACAGHKLRDGGFGAESRVPKGPGEETVIPPARRENRGDHVNRE